MTTNSRKLPARAQYQIPSRVVTNLLDEQCVPQDVLDVLVLDTVAPCRAEHLHAENRTTKPGRVQICPRLALWAQNGHRLSGKRRHRPTRVDTRTPCDLRKGDFPSLADIV